MSNDDWESDLKDLSRKLLAHTYLLPPDTLAQDAALLATLSAGGEGDYRRLSEIGAALYTYLDPPARQLLATLDREHAFTSVATTHVVSTDEPSISRAVRAARTLLSMADHASPENREGNRETLATAAQTTDVHDPIWGSVSLIAGIYCRKLDLSSCGSVQRLDLLQSGLWAVQYEQAFRKDSLNQRRNQVFSLLSRVSAAQCEELLQAETESIYEIADALSAATLIATLKRLEKRETPLAGELVARMSDRLRRSQPNQQQSPNTSDATNRSSLADAAAILKTSPDPKTALALIDTAWSFLDPKREADNRRKRAQAQQGERQTIGQLANTIVHRAEYTLRNKANGARPSQAEYLAAARLALFNRSPQSTEFGYAIATAIRLITRRHLAEFPSDLTNVIDLYSKLIQELPGAGSALRSALLEDLRQSIETAASSDMTSWTGALAALAGIQWTDPTDMSGLTHLLDELERLGIPSSIDVLALRTRTESMQSGSEDKELGFLSREGLDRFEEYYRSAQVNEMADLLDRESDRLLATLSREFARSEFETYQPPSRSTRVMVGKANQFPLLRRRAVEGSASEAREAREAFDRAESSLTARATYARGVLREWRVYAAMRADSVLVAIPEWVEAFESGRATDEETWNLAVFHASQHEYAQALNFLYDRVITLRAPYPHLQFAFYLALQVLRQASRGADYAKARTFVLTTARWTLSAHAQLLWVGLSHTSPERPSAIDLSQGISLFKTLSEEAVVIPHPSLPGWPKDYRAVESDLDALRVRVSKYGGVEPWRLWLNGYVARNEDRTRGWEWLADACLGTNDVNEAVAVLKAGATYGMRQYSRFATMGANGKPRKEQYIYMLRVVLLKLCQIAKREKRDTLLRETFETWVRNVPELLVADKRNRQLLELLHDFVVNTDSSTQQEQAPTGPSVWNLLHEPLYSVKDVTGFTAELADRIEASLSLYPGSIGSGRAVTSRARSILETIRDFQASGVSRDEVAGLFSRLSEDVMRLRSDVARMEMPQLRALVEAFARAVVEGSSLHNAVPRPEVKIPSEWIGFPKDLNESEVVLEIVNPGPGVLTNLELGARCVGTEGRFVRGAQVPALSTHERACVTVPMRADSGSQLEVEVNLQYDWGLVTNNVLNTKVIIPYGDYASLVSRAGSVTQEAPDPYVADGPLNNDQVQSDLFQGRVRELLHIADTYGSRVPPPAPTCFYGIRRTGKTSLLRRVKGELSKVGLLAVETPLNGLSAEQNSTRELVFAFLHVLERSLAGTAGLGESSFQYSFDHPSPVVLLEDAFRHYAGQTSLELVYLFDEFQLLLGHSSVPILDALRSIYDRGVARFIFFANQGHDIQINTSSQLAVTSSRVDFLSAEETAELARRPFARLGLTVHDTALAELYRQTAGHPNFTAKVLKAGLERVNQSHRNLLVGADITDICSGLSKSPGAFNVSWFSRQNLSEAEEDVAIRFAKAAKAHGGTLSMRQVTEQGFELVTLRELEQKQVLIVKGDDIQIKGDLLFNYLSQKIAAVPVPASPEDRRSERVGLFVDLENMDKARQALGLDAYTFAHLLRDRAAREGSLVCAWAFAKPWHFGTNVWYHLKLELERAGLEVEGAPEELRRRRGAEKNLVDMMLNDQITEEVDDKGLSRIVLVTGDVDHYMMVRRSLDKGLKILMIGAGASSLAQVYGALAEERLQLARSEGRSSPDFEIATLSQLVRGGEEIDGS